MTLNGIHDGQSQIKCLFVFSKVSPNPRTTPQLIRKLIRQGDLESENVSTLLENILEGNVFSAQDVECVESVEHS
uniref:Uncharacterized protein n=1 Tax=Timema douglasi TaxID=61478 RepID=A0A7R8ZGQ4_TIMDO|nr:unnamed protein product [Timema douglasi]